MDLILTHEQADFDALASMLGAYLLHESATPILPRRINRNGRSFLTLYGADLPFIDPRDLPAGEINSVTLVDTQSLVTLKGISTKTSIQVIDHHSLRSDLPAAWTIKTDKIGAATTLFVEEIQERNLPLNPIQATLLLLGIYEDTGALTYASTNPRDVRAVAYLLEQGASLPIATNFLNPPLSDDQRKVYDRLMDAAKRLQIHGLNIIVSVAEATDISDEISSIAHKLRDFLDPDALFLLVRISEGIRLVARSTTDQINVAEIAAHFGGGGHERAAAALIHLPHAATVADEISSLQIFKNELIGLLPQMIHPPITVGQIMSRRPQVLEPETSAAEAAQLMQRFGYEGYPVVDGGKVIGLLTRRAVDRAVAHKLNLNAASLMEAGEITVQPGDSLERLQQIMTTSGWGQIPVVDPENGKVIGIVTRTDLLKTLSPEPNLPARQNMANRLEAALKPGRLSLLKLVARQAQQQRMAIYIVGGFVRDLLLERPSLDFDIVVEGNAITLAKSLAAFAGGRVVSHSRFGTAKWHLSEIRQSLANLLQENGGINPEDIPDSLDMISSRTEFYDHPTALPTIRRSSIKLDLHRRDFTINTLALRLDGSHYGELHDYWGGLNDLHQGLVRVLHSLSFIDDPTRTLRAVRFEKRFDFSIESRTLQLIGEAQQLIEHLSGERIRHEIDLILAEEHPVKALARLSELGLLKHIHPDLPWNKTLEEQLEAFLEKPIEDDWDMPSHISNTPIRNALVYIYWLSELTGESLDSLTKRLRLPRPLSDAIQCTSRLRRKLSELSGQSPSQIMERMGNVTLPALYVLYHLTPDKPLQHIIRMNVSTWRKFKPTINGNDLKRRGLSPGPVYKTILNSIRSAWLDGKIHTREEENALLEELLKGM